MVQVRVLGEQSVTDSATGSILTRSPRAVALIAFLATHAGSPQPRQRIAAQFWPDSSDAQALTNLRRELHHLRNALGDEPALVVTSRDLCWRDSATSRVDVRTFGLERAAALAAAAKDDTEGVLTHAAVAIAEYQGELLPGSYHEWLTEPRGTLESQCVELCDLVRAVRARQGDLTGAVAVARRRIALRPLEEIGYRTLIRLQAELGDRAGAVSTYHRCVSILERELGIAPDRATRALVQPLLAHSAPEPERSGLPGAALVGRAKEIGELAAAWRAAAAGRAGLVVVTGGAGLGKTRLLTELADAARRRGAAVATAHCFGTSGRLALGPVAAWLRGPALRPAVADLDPVWRAEVDRLLPTDGNRAAAGAGARAMVDAWQRHRFFEGLARALTGVGTPLLLVLDNMQWCDQETLAFLAFCLGRAPGARLLVAGTLRDDPDEDTEAVTWCREMQAAGMLTELTLHPLETADTARLAETVAGRPLAPATVGLLQATTGGFPLYVVEAMRAAADLGHTQLPAGDLASVLRTRFEHVSPAARSVAGLAAAVGRDFPLDLLTEASHLDTDAVVAALDELWQRRIVVEQPDGYDFSHDLLRDAAYAQVSPPQRWLLHRRLAQSLALLHTDDTDAVAVQLADQYARGGRPDQALAYYARAADIASGTFAHGEAIRLHRAALAIIATQPDGTRRQRQELTVLEAMAAPLNARHGYASAELRHTLERSIELATALERTDSILAGLVGLWASQFVQGTIADAHRTAARALAMAAPDSQLSGSAHFAFGGAALSLGRPAEGLRHFDLAARQTAGASTWTVGTRPDVHCRAWSAHAHWLLGHDDLALTCGQQAVELARTIGHPYNLAVALGYVAITHQLREDVPAVRETADELHALCERHGFAYYREWALVLAGWSRSDGSGVALAREGIDRLKAQGAFARMPYWLSLLARLQDRAGRPGDARATLDAALVAGQARDDLWWLPEVLRLRSAYDSPGAAAERLATAARLARDHGSAALLRRCAVDGTVTPS
ncbi:MAG TPA: AAA family ATPase [Pseudonocardiaceae bacterium]|jgi:DNA-binding SARP family transcriptional activator/tetratricopeptide (TPR) repeat protein